jgi:hypothetical protein
MEAGIILLHFLQDQRHFLEDQQLSLFKSSQIDRTESMTLEEGLATDFSSKNFYSKEFTIYRLSAQYAGILYDNGSRSIFEKFHFYHFYLRAMTSPAFIRWPLHIVGDGCISSKTISFLYQLTTLSQNISIAKKLEILYLSFLDDLTSIPFMIALDHQRGWIVITIRGTASAHDAVIDLLVDPVELKDAGDRWGFPGAGKWAHEGMLRMALQIREELEKIQLLHFLLHGDKMMNSENIPSWIRKNLSSTSFAHYSLVITGHSLGSGVGSLLAMLLKPQFPGVKGYFIGAVGSLVDEETSSELSGYVTSITRGDDIVGRLSLVAVHRLQAQVIELLYRSKLRKYDIQFGLLFENKFDISDVFNDSSTLWKRNRKQEEKNEGIAAVEEKKLEIMENNNNQSPTLSSSSTMMFHQHLIEEFEKENEKNENLNSFKVPLYLPGNIIYLQPLLTPRQGENHQELPVQPKAP